MDNIGEARFYCQRCWSTLELDSAFFCSLDEHTLAELSLPAVKTPELDLSSESTSLDNYVPAAQRNPEHGSSQGFTLVGHPPTNISVSNICHLSHYFNKSAHLFDLVSSTSDVDHPLCQECADSLLSILDHQLVQAEEECLEYKRFLSKIAKEPKDDGPSSSDYLEKELASLQLEEKQLKMELKDMLKQQEIIAQEIAEEKEEQKRVEQDEDKFWKLYSVHHHQQFQAVDEQSSLEHQLQFTQSNLDRLKVTNSFNSGNYYKFLLLIIKRFQEFQLNISYS